MTSIAATGKSLTRSSILMLLAFAVAGALSFAISIQIARSVDVSEFGRYSIVISFQGVFSILAGFSMGSAAAKFVSQHWRYNHELAIDFARTSFMFSIASASIVSVCYAALAGAIGGSLYNDPRIAELIPYSALVVLSGAAYTTTYGILQGCQKITSLAVIHVAYPALAFASIAVLLPEYGIRGAFVGYSLSQFLVLTSAIVYARKIGFSLLAVRSGHRSASILKTLVHFAFPAAISASMIIPLYWLGNTILVLTAGFHETGLFAVAFFFFILLVVIPGAILVPLIPRISELTGTSRKDIQGLVVKYARFISIYWFPIVLTVAVFSEDIVTIIYGSEYESSANLAYLMIIASYLLAMSSAVGGLIAGIGRMWIGLGINSIWAVSFVASAGLFVPLFGANGLCAAFIASYGINLILSYTVSRRYLHVNLKEVYPRSIASTTVLISAYFVLIETSPGLTVKILMIVLGSIIICWPLYKHIGVTASAFYAKLRRQL